MVMQSCDINFIQLLCRGSRAGVVLNKSQLYKSVISHFLFQLNFVFLLQVWTY